MSCLCLVLTLLATLVPSSLARPNGLAPRQLASSEDADGNTVVYSVTSDAAGVLTTTTLETLPAGATTTAVADAGGNVGVGGNGAETPSVNLGQATAAPTTTGTSRAPPTTFWAYTTEGGRQITLTLTFTATTPVTPPPMIPSSGSVVALSDYLPPSSTGTAIAGPTSGAGASQTKFSRQNGQVAAIGVLLSMLVGAIVVL